MAVELATGYVSILPSTKGLGKALQRDLGKEVAKTGTQTGNTLGSRLASGLKTSVKVGGVAAGVAAGAAVVSGFKSAVSQETAEKTLAGLYGSAEKASSTMKGLQKVASVSPIDYEGYTKAAQSLAYAGVEGNKAIGILKNVGLAITAGGGSTENMDSATGAVLKMVNAGKVQLDTLQQLSDAGVPILSGLAEHFKKPMEEVNVMASKGQIGLEDVLSVMENATGSTFKQMKAAGKEASQSFGNQWKIAKDNISNALGRVMLPAIEKLTPALSKVGQLAPAAIEKMGAAVGPVASTISDKLGKAFSSIPWGDLTNKVKGALSGISFEGLASRAAGARKALEPVLAAVKEFGGNVADAAALLMPAFVNIGKAIAPMAETVIKLAGKAVFGALVLAMKALGPVLKTVAGWFKELSEHKTLVQVIAGLAGAVLASVAAFKAYKAAVAGVKAVQQAYIMGTYGMQAAQKGLGTSLANGIGRLKAWMIQLKASTVMQKVAAAATKVWTVVQRAFNAVMRANPIGLIITGLVLLGTALVIAYKKSDKFRSVVDKAWAVIKRAVVSAWQDYIKPAFQALWSFIQKYLVPVVKLYVRIWKTVLTTVAKIAKWAWEKVIKPAFQALWRFITKTLIPIFRKVASVAKTVFKAIGTAVRWAWEKIIQPAFKAVWTFIRKYLVPVFKFYLKVAKTVFRAIGAAVKFAWTRVIKPAFSGIWNFIKQNLVPVFNWAKDKVGTAFRNIGSNIKWVWNNVIQPAFEALKKGVDKVKQAFGKAKDFIATTWGKIKGAIKKPILGAIDIINSVLIKPINTVIDKLGGKEKTISTIPTKGFSEGGYTGRLPRKRVAGVVHGDEFVTRATSRKRLEAQRPGALDYMNETGRWPGYAKGGKVKRVMPLAGASFSTYAGHTGVDLNAPNDEGKPVRSAAPGVVSSVASLTTSYGKHVWVNHGGVKAVYGHLSAYNVKPGQKLAAGQQLGNVGSTGNSTGPHLHFEIRPPSPGTYASSVGFLQGASNVFGGASVSGDAQAQNWISKISDAVSSVKEKVAKFSGAVGSIIKGTVEEIGGQATKWITDKIGNFFLGDPDKRMIPTGAAMASGGKSPDAARSIGRSALVGMGWGNQWPALDSLWTRESGWRWNADNPSSSAYGIPQALPGSKMASAGADWATNPVTQIRWGLKYIRDRYGSPNAAWAHSQSTGWYDKGGWLKPGLTMARNDTGKPEAVLTGSQWDLLKKWLPGKQTRKDRPVKLKELERMVSKVLDKYGKKSEKGRKAADWLKAAKKAQKEEKEKPAPPLISNPQWKALRRWLPGRQTKRDRPTSLKQLENLASKVLDRYGAKSRRYQKAARWIRNIRFSLDKGQWSKLQKWVPKLAKKRGKPETPAELRRFTQRVRRRYGADSRQYRQARQMQAQARLGGQYTGATWDKIRRDLIPQLGKGGTAKAAVSQILKLVTQTFGPHSPISRHVDRLATRVGKAVKRFTELNSSLTKAKQARTELTATVRDAFREDAFGNGVESLRLTLAANTNDARAFGASLKKATQKGLSGGLLKALAASGDRQTALEISNLSRAQIAALEKQWTARQKATANVGAQVAQLAYGPEIKRLRASIAQQNRVLSNLRSDIRQATFAGTKAGIQAKTNSAKAKSKTRGKGKGKYGIQAGKGK